MAAVTEVIIGEKAVDVTLAREPTEVVLQERGPQGRQGPPGQALAYVHTQSSPLAEWVVNHNLGAQPLVSVTSPGGVEVEALIVHQSVNQFRVYFDQPYSGFARCI